MTKLKNFLSRLCMDEEGAVATEYALLIVFIALLAAVGMILLGQGLAGLFTGIGSALNSAPLNTLPPVTAP